MTAPAFADPAEAAAFAQYRQAQEEEYGTWVAVQNIYVGNALAYLAGHPVPKSNVEQHGYDQQGLVVRQGTVAPEPGVDRAQQLADRMAELEREREAIAAELATANPEAPADTTTAPAKKATTTGKKEA